MIKPSGVNSEKGHKNHGFGSILSGVLVLQDPDRHLLPPALDLDPRIVLAQVKILQVLQVRNILLARNAHLGMMTVMRAATVVARCRELAP